MKMLQNEYRSNKQQVSCISPRCCN